MEIKKELQLLPFSVNKKQLMSMYLGQMTEKQIRDGINAIIADNRNIGASSPVYVQLIWHSEFEEFIELYGLPKGYKKEFKTQ